VIPGSHRSAFKTLSVISFQLSAVRVLCLAAGLAVFWFCLAGAFGTCAGCAAERGTIGARLGRTDDGRLIVRETPAGLAAARAGLQPGDEILLINGLDVRQLDEKALHRLLSGDVGDTVKLTLVRGEQVLHVTLWRTAVPPRKAPGGH
jgi:predicted metalloprotease with PDZ domain